MSKRLRRFSAYLLVKTLVAIAQILPRSIGSTVFGKLGALAYVLLRTSRGIAVANIKLVYGRTVPDRDIMEMAKAAFVNLGRFAYDVARIRKQTPQSIRRIVKVTGLHHLDRALAKGKGVIAITGHVGNWELLAAYFSLMGYRVNVLATNIRNGRLNNLLVSLRHSAGLSVLERSRGLKEAFRCLKRGEVLGVLIDQDTSVESVVVDFLGKPAKTAVGPVRMASRTGAAIIPLAMLMRDDGNYEIEIKEPVRISGDEAYLQHDVERCSKAVESFIYREPSQWVWMHKRWKSVLSELYTQN